MTGGLLLLAAIGAQDVYLTGKPDIVLRSFSTKPSDTFLSKKL